MDKKKTNPIESINFLKNNVYSITELTRSNKLSEILSDFSGKKTSEIYVIQNNKNKDAAGILADVEYFEYLLKLQTIFEQVIDERMKELTIERQNDVADIDLKEALKDEEFEFNEILALADELEIDGD